METIKDQVLRHLMPLVGRKLSIARLAADMRGFHFGHVTFEEGRNRSYGEFSLHIQCPWRIEGPDGILTGSADLWEPADPDEEVDWDTWRYDKNENLQDLRLSMLLGGYDSRTRSHVNNSEQLIVIAIDADEFGGAMISFSGGYRLVIFSSSSTREDWRLFPATSAQRHFVVSGGKIRGQGDKGRDISDYPIPEQFSISNCSKFYSTNLSYFNEQYRSKMDEDED